MISTQLRCYSRSNISSVRSKSRISKDFRHQFIPNCSDIFNIHATYVLGQVTLSAEWNDFEDGAGKDGDGYLILGTYSLNDKTSIAVRYSEVDADGTASDLDKFTVSPTYSVTDNLRAGLEYSTGEYNDKDVDVFALEAILTF